MRSRHGVEQLFGLYVPGESIVHRLPAGVKLGLLAVLSILAAVSAHWQLLAPIGLVTAAGFVAAGLAGRLAGQVWSLKWLILAVAAGQVLFALPVPLVVANTARMTIVIVLAALVTVTTRTSDILDAVEGGLRPFRRFGLDAARVSLTLSIALRTVPLLARTASGIRDAQRARGRRFSITAFVVPLLVAALRQADDLADALAARGLDDGPPPTS
jgi:biotin transport system permease protein